MDSMVMILFASVIATMTALCFMELRRIRRNLERRTPTETTKTQTPASRASA
jgi:hypothetical protein